MRSFLSLPLGVVRCVVFIYLFLCGISVVQAIEITAVTWNKTLGTGDPLDDRAVDGSERWNTFYSDAAWDIGIYEGEVIIDPEEFELWRNDPDDMSVNIELLPATTTTFTIGVSRNSNVNDNFQYNVNLFFDGLELVPAGSSGTPGISVVALSSTVGPESGDFPDFTANGNPSTTGWPFADTPGSGSLVYENCAEGVMVTMTDFVVFAQTALNGGLGVDLGTKSTAGQRFIDASDGEPDLWAQFTLEVQGIPPQEPCILFIPPSDLTCQISESNVDLTWENQLPHQLNPAPYDSIKILRNGGQIAAIAGDASSFQDTNVPAGETFIYQVKGVLGSKESGPTCTVDNEPPRLISATRDPVNSRRVTVKFSEAVSELTATESFNYLISGGVSINSAARLGDSSVVLTTSPISVGFTIFTLTVDGVEDLFGNVIAADSQTTVQIPASPGLPPPAEDLILWLDAEEGVVTDPFDDRTVTAWRDQAVGDGLPTIDGVGVGTPELEDAEFPNGDFPVVRFRAPDQINLTPMPADSLNLNELSIYIVASISEVVTTRLIIANLGVPDRDGWIVQLSDGRPGVVSWTTNLPGDRLDSHTVLEADVPVIITATYSETMSPRKKLFINGLEESSSENPRLTYPNTGTRQLLVGGGPGQHLNGDIAEILVYSSVSAQQRAQVEGYLIGRYFVEPLPSFFKRGDSDSDGVLSIGDPVFSLFFQFLGTLQPLCLEALDFNDNGVVDITDPLSNLGHQFLGTAGPPDPGSETCGFDTTSDPDGDLGCTDYPADRCP